MEILNIVEQENGRVRVEFDFSDEEVSLLLGIAVRDALLTYVEAMEQENESV